MDLRGLKELKGLMGLTDLRGLMGLAFNSS